MLLLLVVLLPWTSRHQVVEAKASRRINRHNYFQANGRLIKYTLHAQPLNYTEYLTCIITCITTNAFCLTSPTHTPTLFNHKSNTTTLQQSTHKLLLQISLAAIMQFYFCSKQVNTLADPKGETTGDKNQVNTCQTIVWVSSQDTSHN